MISEKMQKALNDQLKEEYFSSYLYLSMAAYFESNNLNGFAHWMKTQSEEEKGHAMKFYGYINEQQARVSLNAIDKPQMDWVSSLAAFEETLKHEQKITKHINTLMDLAIAEKDHATTIFLQWFITEQVEEEAHAAHIAEQLKMIGDSKQGLMMLNSILGQRK
jgi:ferritin